MPRLRALVVALLLCAVLGCEAEPTPDIPAPTPSSSAPSPTESESSPSPSPPQALTPEQTVRAWVKAQNLALRTGDTTSLRELSAEGCTGCADYPDGIDKVYNAGGHFEGGLWTLVETRVESRTPTSIRLNVAVRIAGGVTVAEAGAEPAAYEADSRLMTFEMKNVEDKWFISLIAFVS